MKKTYILTAGITRTYTPDEYEWIESSIEEFSEEWDGDVEGFVRNMLENADMDLDELLTTNGTIHNLPEGAIVIGDEDGDPCQMWWAAEIEEEEDEDEEEE